MIMFRTKIFSLGIATSILFSSHAMSSDQFLGEAASKLALLSSSGLGTESDQELSKTLTNYLFSKYVYKQNEMLTTSFERIYDAKKESDLMQVLKGSAAAARKNAGYGSSDQIDPRDAWRCLLLGKESNFKEPEKYLALMGENQMTQSSWCDLTSYLNEGVPAIIRERHSIDSVLAYAEKFAYDFDLWQNN